MILNTKTGSLKLTKSEMATLTKAASLLHLLELHAPSDIGDDAKDAGSHLDLVIGALNAANPAPATTT